MDHHRDDCTGDWKLVADRIQCNRCGREYPATPEHRMAATDANYLGTLLRHATATGDGLLAEDDRV